MLALVASAAYLPRLPVVNRGSGGGVTGCWLAPGGGGCGGVGTFTSSDGFSSVSGVEVTYSDNGVTSNVRLETNKGSVSVSGAEFKKAFNLRAPGSIAIKSGLFNIEKK